MTDFLPYGRQTIDDEDIAAVEQVLRSDRLTGGPFVDQFETAFAETVDAPHAVTCANGTAALHLAALALDLGPGDWVVVPTNTFLATANAVRYVGAEVLFADVDPRTGLMTAETLGEALDANPDKAVKAVFPVHFAGQACEMEAIAKQAHARGLAIVEDACHALGTTYRTRAGNWVKVGACAHADMTVFSFHPVKTIACGEGGMVTTRKTDLAQRLERLRCHGMVRDADDFLQRDAAFGAEAKANPWYYEMQEPGFNYRLSDIHCALGLSQLGKLGGFLERRRDLVAAYDAAWLTDDARIVPLGRVENCKAGWHLYPVLLDFEAIGKNRAEVMNRLREIGIGTQVHYIPVHEQPYYRSRYGDQTLHGAQDYYTQTLSLPLFPDMSDDDLDRVSQSVMGLLP